MRVSIPKKIFFMTGAIILETSPRIHYYNIEKRNLIDPPIFLIKKM
jgi:hypothetical protein